jgi:phospholipase C
MEAYPMRHPILNWLASAACTAGCSTSNGSGPSDAAPSPADATSDSATWDSAASDSSASDSAAQPPSDGGAEAATGLQKVNHIVVIVLENWSFDSLYGEFDGGDGLANAADAALQIDPTTGQPYVTLPQTEAHLLDASLPNAPFALDPYLTLADETSSDLTLNYYTEQQQIDKGKMDLFVANNVSKGLTMGYFHTTDLPLAAMEAMSYTLCDHFFHGVFGGSLPNHIFLISAGMAQFPNAPASLLAVLDSSGVPVKDDAGVHNGPLTPDGYVIGTLQPYNTPHAASAPAAQLVPPQTFPTIGDELTAAGVDWAWYAGGWNDAVAGVDAGQKFQFHHQPFVYFANYADGMPGRSHLKDQNDFVSAAKAGSLPAVSFVKPVGEANEHPNYANMITGEENAEALIAAVRNGPNWHDSVIVVTYDEFGGFWDHVPPPTDPAHSDKWGPGTRVPAIVISPFSKKGVDSTPYDTTSITALIEHRFNVAPLGTRDSTATPLTGALDFSP